VTALEAIAREIDAYAGAAGDVVPPVGVIAVPLRMLAKLREALRQP
jgi:hypothetical protein